MGGELAALIAGGTVSLGALAGFLAVFAIAARNGIAMVTHYQRLERHEGETHGPSWSCAGARDRLAPILMTASATALAMLPFVVLGNRPGYEVVHPMAIVVIGGLVTSTLLSLFVVPALYLRFGGRRPRRWRPSSSCCIAGPASSRMRPQRKARRMEVEPEPAVTGAERRRNGTGGNCGWTRRSGRSCWTLRAPTKRRE